MVRACFKSFAGSGICVLARTQLVTFVGRALCIFARCVRGVRLNRQESTIRTEY
jgi:hypothetical protein